MKAKPEDRRTIYIVVAAVSILSSAMMLAGCGASFGEKSASGVAGGKPVPAPITVESIAQNLEEMKGKVVVLDLWATWCGPCKMEIPSFIKLQDKYRAQGVEIVGVSLDPITHGGTAQMVHTFMQQNNINYTIWVVNNPAAIGKYPVGQGIPTTYVIDRAGRTVKQYVGAQPESVFEDDIKSLL